jgi:hypothetical protein
VDFVANAVADYLNGRNLQRTLNNPNQGLQEGPADIAELFKPFDTNQDGRLSYPDFKKGLRGLNLGLTSEECEKVRNGLSCSQLSSLPYGYGNPNPHYPSIQPHNPNATTPLTRSRKLLRPYFSHRSSLSGSTRMETALLTQQNSTRNSKMRGNTTVC